MDNIEISFPTIGEVIREVFNCSGLLAQKEDKLNSNFSAGDRKKLQMQLKRLADESSKIDGKLDELLTLFKQLLSNTINEERIIWMIMDFLEELLIIYKSVLKSDGTYLNQQATTKWLIKSYLLDRLVISFFKNHLRFNVARNTLDVSKLNSWIFPTISEKKVIWPLSKAWKEIYNDTSITQSLFHYPDKAVEDFRAIRNLENAQHWGASDQLPSIGALFNNFDYSLAQLKCTSNQSAKRFINEQKTNEYKLMLFISRLSTYFFQKIKKAYGDEFLLEVIKQLQGQSGRLSRINRYLTQEICGAKKEYLIQEEQDVDNLHFNLVSNYWKSYSEKIHQGAMRLQEYLFDNAFEGLSQIEIARVYISCIGSFNAYSTLETRKSNPLDDIPNQFIEMFNKGEKLKKAPNSIFEVDNYRKELTSLNLILCLEWLSDWCYANFYYRNNNHVKAHFFYEKAFNKAKYTAGKFQYLLVNQYIESCAKNKKFSSMKRAVAWANYLGFEVRWLRNWDNPESDESLKCLYALLGNSKMTYGRI